MSWREPSTQNWIQMANCCLILLAACAFDWDIRKTWLFASSFEPLSAIAAVCTHAQGSHKSIAGTKDEHGIYLSRRSAAYPTKLAEAFAQKNQFYFPHSKMIARGIQRFHFFPTKIGSKIPKVLWMGEVCNHPQTGPDPQQTKRTSFDRSGIFGFPKFYNMIYISLLWGISSGNKWIHHFRKTWYNNSVRPLTHCCPLADH